MNNKIEALYQNIKTEIEKLKNKRTLQDYNDDNIRLDQLISISIDNAFKEHLIELLI
ncbi:MAG: hypothetical protein RBS16_01740 [Candidatus Cloacimonadales bacterium]|jgi:hypothetical protein|nr:hypothetical protein [Candidatus Cloacimonadota bacterium]MDX9976734.1 hypothetical protein [Candidatus Cloacimonadales bacterium]